MSEKNTIEIPADRLYLLVRTLKETNKMLKEMEPIDWVTYRDNKAIGIFANKILKGDLNKVVDTAVHKKSMVEEKHTVSIATAKEAEEEQDE